MVVVSDKIGSAPGAQQLRDLGTLIGGNNT